MDANSRSDLRELHELNFARFDAKVEQRFAEFDVKLEQRFAESDVRVAKRCADLRVELQAMKSELLKWIVGLLGSGALLNYLLR